MSATPPSLQQETFHAAQGAWRLLIGRRDAPGYFDTSLRGLVSSFIALFASIAITLGAAALSQTGTGVSSFALVVTNAVLYAALVAASWVVLQAVGKREKFVPFLAVDNWLNAFISIVLALVGLMGLSGEMVMFAAIVAGLAARINNARLVAELSVGQIVMLMVAQVIGVFIGLAVLGLFIPVPV
ncbi:hypothetical protein [Pelagibacterium sediminicola]|uniref:hypothetical protein n=1 Tax=Pelagibacterium sediminicola TaxID=2248761 RepID=UPI0013006FD4|nr:hypothetical protein [Pelagibacterium sediminicola]